MQFNRVYNKEHLFHPVGQRRLRDAHVPRPVMLWDQHESQPGLVHLALFGVLFSVGVSQTLFSVYRRFLVISMGEMGTTRSTNNIEPPCWNHMRTCRFHRPVPLQRLPRLPLPCPSRIWPLLFLKSQSLPRILVAMQAHSTTTTSASAISPLAGNVTLLSSCSNTGSSSSHLSSPASDSSGNFHLPFFRVAGQSWRKKILKINRGNVEARAK